jgi:hypothetical protein
MEIIGVAESDDCGPFVIVDSDLVSIMKLGDLYLGATRCAYRNTPITCELTESQALAFIRLGVQCIDVSEENIDVCNEKD